MDEESKILFYIQCQLNHQFQKMVELKTNFIKTKSHKEYKSLFKFMKEFTANMLLPSLEINKKVRIELYDDDCYPIYTDAIFVTRDERFSENSNLSETQIHKRFDQYIRKYSSHKISDSHRDVLKKLMEEKISQRWKNHTDGKWKMTSSYTPGSVTFGVTNTVTVTFTPTSGITYSTETYNNYTGIVITSTSSSQTITFNKLSSDFNIGFLAVGAGGGASGNLSGGGGGGITYIPDSISDFSDYLSGEINTSIPITIGLGGSQSTNGGNTVFGQYTSYGGSGAGSTIGGTGGGSSSSYGGGGGGGGGGFNSNSGGDSLNTTGGSGGSNSNNNGSNYGENGNNLTTSNKHNYPGSGGSSYYTASQPITVPFYNDSTHTTINCGGGAGGGLYLSDGYYYGQGGNGAGGNPFENPSSTSNLSCNGSTFPNSYGGGAGIYNNYGAITHGVGGHGVVMFWWQD